MTCYLLVWSTVTFTAAGALGWLLIDHALAPRWAISVRPLAAWIAWLLVPLAFAFIPLVVLADDVWPWADPPPELAHALASRHAWFSLPCFAIRGLAYFAIWLAPLVALRRWPARSKAIASAFLLPVALATSFAAVDWWMSLDPFWTSSAFGLYAIAGALTSGLALVILVGWRTRRLDPKSAYGLGRVLLVFVLAWGYVAYLQTFLIQIADRPDEIRFFVARSGPTGRLVTALLVALHFAIPFPFLVPRRLKQRPTYLAAVAAMLVVAHVVDVYWVIGRWL